MRFTIITAFPDFFRDFLSTSIVGRALKNGLFEVRLVDLRSFGKGGYRQVDDYSFGSGGMVLMSQPLQDALETARGEDEKSEGEKPFVVYPSPQGVFLTQEVVESLFHQPHVVVVCGHYEGIDERFVEREVDLEVTIGDCVLTGGEIPAMAIVDMVSRLIPGVVGKSEAVTEDSFYRGMLDHPHYTRPASWKGQEVPAVLLSGNAVEIESWRRRQAVIRTLSRRPDLLARNGILGYTGAGFYVVVEFQNAVETSIGCMEEAYMEEAMKVKEWARSCEGYGVSRLILIVKNPEKREFLRRVWRDKCPAPGGIEKAKLMPSMVRAVEWVKEKEKRLPLIVRVSDNDENGARHWLDIKRIVLEKGHSVLFYFSEKTGLKEDFCDVWMIPLQGGRLSLLGKMAATLDRFLGSK
ncbi:MAG: tRNA (guanosine(37)-N1)-methyltransferase TrmD [Synergistaceae bacterium]|jgi:tRNA (guanine37-N1)-methyltransferase|nr:tRNA (guanosine(37)-N1)-methyltransferase TrmD [Synergistaceae bacterium]